MIEDWQEVGRFELWRFVLAFPDERERERELGEGRLAEQKMR